MVLTTDQKENYPKVYEKKYTNALLMGKRNYLKAHALFNGESVH